MGTTEATITAPAGTAPAVTTLRRQPAAVYLILAFGMLGISFTAIFTKWAAVPGPAAAVYRMSIALAILTVPFALRLRSRRAHAAAAGATVRPATLPAAMLSLWRWARLAALGGVWFGVNLAFLNSALMLTSAATATLLDNTAPIWVGVGAMFLFRERLRWLYWTGLALALVGAAVVSGLNPAHLLTVQSGDALAFTGAFFYAAFLLTTQRAREHLDTISTLWFIELGATATLLVLVLALRVPLTGYPVRSYLALLAVAVVSQTVGWLLIQYALGYLPASTAVVVLLGQPIVTSLLSMPLLGEPLSLTQIAGGALVLTGIYFCVRTTRTGK